MSDNPRPLEHTAETKAPAGTKREHIMLHSCIFLALSAIQLVAAKCTKTDTVYTTITAGTITTSSEYPTTTVKLYSSTVLVGTAYAGPDPFPYVDGNPVNCGYYTGTAIPTSPTEDVQARDAAAATKCTTVQTTVTVEYLCVQTNLIYPPPAKISKKGTLTTKVPAFCTNAPKVPGGNGIGNSIYSLGYPYFAQTAVECCIFCSEQYKDLVASAYIPEGEDCQCLVNTDGDYADKSYSCPRGIETYDFGKKKGQALPGPCRKASS